MPLRTILFLALLSTSASALTLDLSAIGERVRQQHPSLKAARMVVEEARGRQLGAGRLSNPSIGFDWRSESRIEPGSGMFSLDQSFPLTRRLTLEKKLTAQLVAAAEFEVRDAERRVVFEARTVAVQLLALERQKDLLQQQTDLAKKLSDFAKSRVATGEISPLDAAQAQVDVQRHALEARKVDAHRTSLLGQLKPMLGLAPHDSLIIRGDLTAIRIPADKSWQQRPDFQLAQTKEQAAQTEAALAKSKRLQDVSFGLVGGPEQQTSQGQSTQRTGFIGFRFSIPLPLWNRNQGEIAEKAASAERARLEKDALASQITSEADTARREMEANAALLRETRDQFLPLVLEQTHKLEKAYEAGQTDLLTVLRARDQRLELESGALDAARDFHLARIRYEAAVGKL